MCVSLSVSLSLPPARPTDDPIISMSYSTGQKLFVCAVVNGGRTGVKHHGSFCVVPSPDLVVPLFAMFYHMALPTASDSKVRPRALGSAHGGVLPAQRREAVAISRKQAMKLQLVRGRRVRREATDRSRCKERALDAKVKADLEASNKHNHVGPDWAREGC